MSWIIKNVLRRRIKPKHLSATIMIGAQAGKRALRKVIQTVPDRRDWIASAAQHLGISEDQFQIQAAKRWGLVFIQNVPSLNLNALPTGCGLSELRKAGAIPLIREGMVVGMAVVSPAESQSIAEMCGITKRAQFHLGSWAQISAALDESERIYIQAREKRKEDDRRNALEQGERVVMFVKERAAEMGATKVRIGKGTGRMMYQFETSACRSARGFIDDTVSENVMTFLESCIGTDSAKLQIRKAGEDLCLEWGNERVGKEPSAVSPIRKAASGIHLASPVKDVQEVNHSVLIVDDNPTFAKVLERFLARQSLHSTHVTDGEEALQTLSAVSTPDLIICDVHMPGMSGFEFLVKLRSDSEWADIPVIMLTSDTDIETELKVLELGADAFIAKSDDPRLLCLQARKLIDNAKSRKAA